MYIFQNIFPGRQVFPSSGVNCSRPGIRVKSASESEHLLVISKSLSNSKEDFSPHAFGHFDENRVYTTLFRHSTCYDVLPDSGKLVILDSRLPTLRAMSALLDNGVMAAPVWSNETQSYLGVFSQDLALDMLAHLHYSEVNSNGNMDCPSTVFSSSSSSSPPSSFSPFKTNFFRWGSKQLGEILNLMYGLSNHQLSSYLLVHPQYCLQKALYQLFHHLEHHNSNQQQQHHHHHCNDTLLNFKLSNASGHRASYPNNSPKMLIEKETTTGVNFTRQSSTLFPTHSNHSSSELSPVHNPTPQSTSTDHPMSNGKNNHNSSLNSSSSSSPLLHFQRVSSKCCPHSNPSSLYTSLVSHLLVVDHHSGNALGLLGADRLLAYLRLRVDELPCTGRMNVPIGSVYGLRWSERYSSIKTPNDSKPCTRLIPSPPPATTTPTVTTIKVNGYSLSQKEIPVIHPNDCVRDVLHVLAIWLPQLPCLPVIQFMENNQMRPIDFIGLISSSDILNFIICSTPDTALDEPISKLCRRNLCIVLLSKTYWIVCFDLKLHL
ncbi:unnamed protein product [Heterobilharzia americana]|nr:unnamed protein product [Heterobilharzia americana]